MPKGIAKSEPGNLQPLCRTCNASKGARLVNPVHNIEVLET